METFSGEKLAQSEYELGVLIKKLQENGCNSWLEIGVRHGDTFYEIMRSLPKGSKGVAVELPEAAWGKEGSYDSLQRCCRKLDELGYDITLILGNSTAKNVIERVRSHGPFDAVLIDGDHRYEGVKKDWLNYRNLGRMVVFHDIVGECYTHHKDPTWVLEVPKLWSEIKNDYKHEEIVDKDAKMGIGIVYMA